MINAQSVERAVILVAGGGTRLKPITNLIPKCLVEVNGISILENALSALADCGTRSVRIVVGHLYGEVEKRITGWHKGMSIEYIHNTAYSSTNSMYSLYLGLEGINEPSWVIEGDVFFDKDILKTPTDKDFTWFVDGGRKDLDGAHLSADGNNRVVNLEIIREKCLIRNSHFKSIGILKLGGESVAKLRDWLNRGVFEGKTSLYYDLIVAEYFREYYIELKNISGCRWYEIDSKDDLRNAEMLFKN